MKRILARADAEAIRDEIDAKHGYPRKLAPEEVTRVGGGIHVEEVWDTTAVAITGEGDEVAVTVSDDDEKHLEPTRRARLRAAKEHVEERRGPEDKK